jgi:hypothetical protein
MRIAVPNPSTDLLVQRIVLPMAGGQAPEMANESALLDSQARKCAPISALVELPQWIVALLFPALAMWFTAAANDLFLRLLRDCEHQSRGQPSSGGQKEILIPPFTCSNPGAQQHTGPLRRLRYGPPVFNDRNCELDSGEGKTSRSGVPRTSASGLEWAGCRLISDFQVTI